jgi:hypothetical protein
MWKELDARQTPGLVGREERQYHRVWGPAVAGNLTSLGDARDPNGIPQQRKRRTTLGQCAVRTDPVSSVEPETGSGKSSKQAMQERAA